AVEVQYEGQNEQHLLSEHVTKLSPSAYDVLCIMSCMGRFNKQIILDWLEGDTLRMKELLTEAVDVGLLESYEQEVRFSEMHVGEMIYNQLSESLKLELHYKIANLFYSRGTERLNSTDIILMATSFNHS